MTDDFIDFYEILELPLEAERTEIRKRISELYVEAQKNLDHRNFNTRVRYQQLFEMTLPQARYILLDAGRRDDYDRLVKATRAPATAAPIVAPPPASEAKSGQGTGSSFTIAPKTAGDPHGAAPRIDALPDPAPDPDAVAREREELWNKWKSGLQSAMEREAARENSAARAATTPLVERIETAKTDLIKESAADMTASVQPKSKVERPRIKFDFHGESGDKADENAAMSATQQGIAPTASAISTAQLEERRANHRREVMRGELENTGVKGMALGAALVLVPGVIAMTIFMSTYYPPDKVSTLPLKNSALAWLLWIIILAALTFVFARVLSKSLRRKQALQLQLMSYEELLRHAKQD